MKIHFKKRYTIPLIILVALISLRLYLPTFLKKYVNNVLANIPNYYGEVEAIDVNLYKGGYQIKNMYLVKTNAETNIPVVNIKNADISIEWKSLFKGAIVSDIELTQPYYNFVIEDQQKDTINNTDIESWTQALTSLVPIDINHLKIINGKISYIQTNTKPNIDIDIHNVNLDAKNLRNVVQKKRNLPSSISGSAESFGNGKMAIEGGVNLIKEIPDLDISLSLKNANITSINNFTNHYAGVDFKQGDFSFFTEMAIADGYMVGTVKPFLKNLKFISKKDSFIDVIWEGFLSFFKFLIVNKNNNTIATKVPFEGDLNNIKTNVYITIGNTFKNAWIKAFEELNKDEIDFKDATQKADNKKL